MPNAVLDRLRQERQGCIDFVTRTLDEVETGQRDLSDTEQESIDHQKRRVKELDAQIKPLEEFEQLRAVDRQTIDTYRPAGGGHQERSGGGDYRPATHTQPRPTEYRTAGQMLADAWKAQNRNDDAALQRLEGAGLGLRDGAIVQRAAPNVVLADTPGILPTPIIGDVMKNIDAARPFITSVGPKDLGGIPGSSFKRPVLTTSTSIAQQATELSTVQAGTFVIGSVTFDKDTYGGYVSVSRQDIDWTSPGVWDALMQDFQEQYGLATENAAADAFVTAVTAATATDAVDGAAPTVSELLQGLYAGAALAYAGAGRLPDRIWQSLDQWSYWGPLIDQLKATTAGDGGGSSSLTSFAGNLLNVERVVVPSFASGTTIIGVTNRTEVYEDRFGFLTAVQPKVFGVDVAYGGYMASGTLKASAFAKVTFQTAV